MISRIRDQEHEIKKRMRDAECNLLIKVEQNPKIWNANSLTFEIMRSAARFIEPSIRVNILLNFCEVELSGPIAPINWHTVGIDVKCFPKFKVSFECKNDSNGHLGYCRIGTWFGLGINSKKSGTYDIRLKQANGLFDDSNQHATDSKDHNLNNKQWNKELWYKRICKKFERFRLVIGDHINDHIKDICSKY